MYINYRIAIVNLLCIKSYKVRDYWKLIRLNGVNVFSNLDCSIPRILFEWKHSNTRIIRYSLNLNVQLTYYSYKDTRVVQIYIGLELFDFLVAFRY